MATIVKNSNTISPTLFEGLHAEHAAQSVEHVNLAGAMLHTLRADAPRTGRLKLWFLSEAAADAARQLLALPGPAVFTAPERPTWSMTFIRTGPMTLQLDEETAAAWILELGYREVPA